MLGCGPSTGTVSGKVTYKGQLVKGGNVTFVSAQGRPSGSASIKEDGTYKVERVATGPVKICVETESLNPARRSKAVKYSPPPGQKAPHGFAPGPDTSHLYVRIPPQYKDVETTDLDYQVKGGSQTHDIQLK